MGGRFIQIIIKFYLVIMRRIILGLILIFVSNSSFSQSYMWNVVDGYSKKTDTILTSVEYYLPNVSNSINFKDIIAKIKKTRCAITERLHILLT